MYSSSFSSLPSFSREETGTRDIREEKGARDVREIKRPLRKLEADCLKMRLMLYLREQELS